jgi:hypothetical protein
MTTWTRQCIADDPLDSTIASDFDVYMHQGLYQIGDTDEFSTI